MRAPTSTVGSVAVNGLIDAAMRVFYRHGFHGTGIDRVLRGEGKDERHGWRVWEEHNSR